MLGGGQVTTVDLPCSGHPMSAHTVEQIAVIEQCLTETSLNCEELSTHTGVSVSSVPHLMTRLGDSQGVCKVGSTSVNGGAEMDSIGDMSHPSGVISSRRKRQVKLNYAIDETWA